MTSRYLALSPGLTDGLVRDYEREEPDTGDIMTPCIQEKFDVAVRGGTIFLHANIGDEDHIFLLTDPAGVVVQIDIGEDIEDAFNAHPIYHGDTKGLIADLSGAASITSDVQKVMEVLSGGHAVDTAAADTRRNAIEAETSLRESLEVVETMQGSITDVGVREEIANRLRDLTAAYEREPERD